MTNIETAIAALDEEIDALEERRNQAVNFLKAADAKLEKLMDGKKSLEALLDKPGKSKQQENKIPPKTGKEKEKAKTDLNVPF